MSSITTHTMVRDEVNTVAYGLTSLAPHVEKMLVTDTGSTDGTWELLTELQNYLPNLFLEQVNIEDSRDWGWNNNVLTINFEQNDKLTNVRQSHIDKTETDLCWVLDGDEVYCNKTLNRLLYFVDIMEKAIYVPFLHFAIDHYHTAFGFPLYGRIFKRDHLTLVGKYPDEQHCYNGVPLFPEQEGVLTLTSDFLHPVHHYQMVYKPHRRNVRDLVNYDGPQPEVFYDENIKDLVDRYNVKNNNNGDGSTR